MYKQIEKLKKLGMSSKEAMLFVHDIAQKWYDKGWSAVVLAKCEPFDTQFNKSLTPPINKNK